MSNIDTNPARPRLFIPALAPLYAVLRPLSETWLRVICGLAMIAHGWPKIQAPMGAVGMVEGIGLAPGWFWAPALAMTEFLGGVLLVLGLLTRFAAAGVSVVLLVTVWFHWVAMEQGYSGAELSLLWSAITLYFVAHGGGRYSLDRLIGREL